MGIALSGLSGLSGVVSGGTLVTVTDQEFPILAQADDGFVYRTASAVYPPSTGTTVVTNNVNNQLSKGYNGSTYNLFNVLLRFNTGAALSGLSSLTLTQAKISFRVTSISDGVDNRSVDFEWYPWASLQSSDWTSTSSSTAGSQDLGLFTNGAVNTVTLTSPSGNVSTSGYTGLRLHISGGAPTANTNQLYFASYENVSGYPVPKLLLSYTYIQP